MVIIDLLWTVGTTIAADLYNGALRKPGGDLGVQVDVALWDFSVAGCTKPCFSTLQFRSLMTLSNQYSQLLSLSYLQIINF